MEFLSLRIQIYRPNKCKKKITAPAVSYQFLEKKPESIPEKP